MTIDGGVAFALDSHARCSAVQFDLGRLQIIYAHWRAPPQCWRLFHNSLVSPSERQQSLYTSSRCDSGHRKVGAASLKSKLDGRNLYSRHYETLLTCVMLTGTRGW